MEVVDQIKRSLAFGLFVEKVETSVLIFLLFFDKLKQEPCLL
jgi:hypothetical protein